MRKLISHVLVEKHLAAGTRCNLKQSIDYQFPTDGNARYAAAAKDLSACPLAHSPSLPLSVAVALARSHLLCLSHSASSIFCVPNGTRQKLLQPLPAMQWTIGQPFTNSIASFVCSSSFAASVCVRVCVLL